MKNLILILGVFLIFCQRANTQVKKLKSSYELSNSPQWLKIPSGYATFIQIDYNNDGLDDLVDFEGYDLSIPYTWPGPNFHKNTVNGLIKDTIQINNKKIFASKILVGDYNNDNLMDLFLLTGMDAAGCGNCFHPILPLYLLFNEKSTSFKVDSLSYNGIWGAGSSADIDNDGDIDILTFTIHNGYRTDMQNRVLINNGKGVFSSRSSNLDSIGWVDQAELIDMNNDSYPDLVMNDVFSLTGEYANRFRILWNDQKGNFHQNNSTTIAIPNNLYILDIDAHDVDNDGYKEIILPMNDLQGNWKIFIFKTTDNLIFSDATIDLIQDNPLGRSVIINERFSICDIDNNGKVDYVNSNRNKNIRWEWNGKAFVRNNCNFNIKPNFNTTKYGFCTGDSLKLSISNVNKGDTLKWYFGSKSDLTNVSNKIFTDSTKLFVTRTDSLGCMISSDTIQITKYGIPSSPTISRDTSNNLVASSNGITWYKDGIKIADTTQKFKPTTNGLYTATTTQNGCTSSMSQSYYYLTSSLTNLANGEYIRMSPNPTSNDLTIDYRLNTTTDLFISINDINGRAIISNQKIRPGSKINLRRVISGSYIVVLKDKAGRLIATQKIVKD